jgi:uncharacterized tellurite resistance protein B-like protein
VNVNMAKCLVVSKVLVADGIMTDEEHGFLTEMMRRLALTPDEQRSVVELEELEEADRIVAALSADERREIVSLLVDAASADGHLSPYEMDAVKRVTAALGL